jgi:hypothetical protein
MELHLKHLGLPAAGRKQKPQCHLPLVFDLQAGQRRFVQLVHSGGSTFENQAVLPLEACAVL